MLSSKNISGMEEVRFEAASVLSRIHMEQVSGRKGLNNMFMNTSLKG